MSVLLVDESSFNDANGTPDYARAKAAGVRGVYLKATEGTGYTNPYFDRDRKLAQAAGLAWGAYHFFHPGQSPSGQWNHFAAVAGGDWGQLRPACDYETSDNLPAWYAARSAGQFVNLGDHALGYAMLVYTYPSFAQSGYCAGLGGDPLWLADPSGQAAPAPWAKAMLVQTGQRQVAGIPSAGSSGTDVDTTTDLTPLLIPPKGSTPNPVNGVPLAMTSQEQDYFNAKFAEVLKFISLTNEGSPGHPDLVSRVIAIEEKLGIKPQPEA